MRFTTTLALAGALGLAAVAPSPVLADDSVLTVQVSIADLNLNTHQGRAAALRRIETAVEAVCPYYGSRWVVERPDIQLCIAAARQKAYAQFAALAPRATNPALAAR